MSALSDYQNKYKKEEDTKQKQSSSEALSAYQNKYKGTQNTVAQPEVKNEVDDRNWIQRLGSSVGNSILSGTNQFASGLAGAWDSVSSALIQDEYKADLQRENKKVYDTLSDRATNQLQNAVDANAFGNGKFNEMMVNAMSSTVSSGLSSATSAVTGLAAPEGASLVRQAIAMLPFGASAYGSSFEQALNENPNISRSQAALYGGAEGLKEVGTELMFQGVGLASKVSGGRGIDDLASDKLQKALYAMGKTDRGGKVLAKIGELAVGAAGEGIEEVVGDVLDVFTPIILGKGLDIDSVSLGNLLTDFTVGAMSGLMGEGLGSVGQAVTGRAVENYNNSIQAKFFNEEFNEQYSMAEDKAELLNDIIENGLIQAKDTTAYKVATEMQARQQNGETVSAEDMGRLYTEFRKQQNTELETQQMLADMSRDMFSSKKKGITYEGFDSIRGNDLAMSELGLSNEKLSGLANNSERLSEVENALKGYGKTERTTETQNADQNGVKAEDNKQPSTDTGYNYRDYARDSYSAMALSEAAKNIGGRNGGVTLINALSGSIGRGNIAAYVADAYKLYNEGKTGKKATNLSGVLNEFQAEMMRNAGEMDAKENRNEVSVQRSRKRNDNKSSRELQEGEAYSATGRIVKARTEAEIAEITKRVYEIADQYGFDKSKIHLVEDYITDTGRGMFDPETGEITIMVNHRAFTAEQLFKHELFHSILAGAKNGNKTYVTEIVDAVRKLTDDSSKIDALCEAYAQAYASNSGMDVEAIYEEMLCDAFGGMNEAAHGYEVAELTFKSAQEALVKEGTKRAEATRGSPAEEAFGITYDGETDSFTKNSIDTYSESYYAKDIENASKEIANKIGVSVQKARRFIEDVNSIAAIIASDLARYSYISSPGRSSFVSNVEYGGSIDNSTICAKRRLYTGTIQQIQRLLPNTALSAADYLAIRDYMKEHGKEVACTMCYVEGSRAHLGELTKEFLDKYAKTNPPYLPNMAEMNTPEGQEYIRSKHPEAYEAYVFFMNNNGRLDKGEKALFASQNKPKMYQLSTAYNGEIAEYFADKEDKVKEKNDNGGLRFNSFSDFEIIHLIDDMQVILDMARYGLAGQGYTKQKEFAWAFGPTGMKINLSVICNGVETVNGKKQLTFDESEGMKWSDVSELRNTYPANVGSVVVVFNDEQLLTALADDRIDYVLPFHRSQWKKSQYAAMGLNKVLRGAKIKDYTNQQNEKWINPSAHTHMWRGNVVPTKVTNYMPNTYWDGTKSGKENAEIYLRKCFEDGKRPKFYKFLDRNADGSYSLKKDGSTDGYWKLLIDFRMYDNDGNFAPQMPVIPSFNMEKSREMMDEYTGGHEKFPIDQDTVDWFVGKGPEGKKFSEDVNKNKSGMLYTQNADQKFSIDTSGKYSFASFFSGAGTVDYALRDMANSKFAVEWDKYIAQAFGLNNDGIMFNMSVDDVDLTQFRGQIYHFHASPVCCRYSRAINVKGNELNEADSALDMSTAMSTARALDMLRPAVFTVENVKDYRGSKALKQITDMLDKLGYKYDIDVYNAADLGAATSRDRMFLRAVRSDVGELPAKPSKVSEHTTWYERVADIIDTLPESPMPEGGYMLSRAKAQGLFDKDTPVIVLGGNKGGKLTFAEANKPCPTIIAKSSEARIIMPDGRVLRATPQVIARIQGLGDNFVLPKKRNGEVALTRAYRVIGNGVPVEMTKAIVEPLIRTAEQKVQKYSVDTDYEVDFESSEKFANTLKKFTEESDKNNHFVSVKMQERYKAEVEGTDFDFLERIHNGDKKAIDDLKYFVDMFIDTDNQRQVFNILATSTVSWLDAEGAYKKDITKLKRTASNTFSKKELQTMKTSGPYKSIALKNLMTPTEAHELFNELNDNEELTALADKVFGLVENIEDIIIRSNADGKGKYSGASLADKIQFNTHYFLDSKIPEGRKAQTILHEAIHTVTQYALNVEVWSKGMLNVMNSDFEMRCYSYVDTLKAVLGELRKDANFSGEYGITNIHEMMAELANPRFREKLKKKSLLQRIVDGIKALLGIDKGSNAFKTLNGVLYDMIDNYNRIAFDDYTNIVQWQKNYINLSTGDTIADNAFSNVKSGESVKFSYDTDYEPKSVLRNPDGSIKYVYKAFYAYNGKLYPPMIANLSDEEFAKVKGAVSGTLNALDTPVGVWLKADIGSLALDENGEPLRNTKGRLAVKNAKGGGTLAFRPGWHLGEWPDAKQFNKNSKLGLKTVMPASLVFAKCMIAAENDYQLKAMSYGMSEKGTFNRTQAGLPFVPEDGYYKYRTNADPTTAPWYITGAMKVVEILDDADCAEICKEFGVEPSPRETFKPINLEDYGLKRGKVTAPTDMTPYLESNANRSNKAELDKALADERYADAYVSREINFDDNEIRKEFERNRQDAEYYRQKYAEEGVKWSEDVYSEYDKPITMADVLSLREQGRKHISQFTTEDLKKSQKWAYKYYKELGTKSPFFRAWFGDWRAYDSTPVKIAVVPFVGKEGFGSIVNSQKGIVVNRDTGHDGNGWSVFVGREGINNTKMHSGKASNSYNSSTGIAELIENGILLDSEIHEHHTSARSNEKDNIAFNHRLYSIGRFNGTISLYRINVEDVYSGRNNQNDMRFHNLKYIEKIADIVSGPNRIEYGAESAIDELSAISYTVADLYELVKRYDHEFDNSQKPVAKEMLNPDGTPKVFYHGTKSYFDAFSKDFFGSATDPGWYGRGFYFTDKKRVAEYYAGYFRDSHVMETYLHMENPFILKVAKGDNKNRVIEDIIGRRFDDAVERSEAFTDWLKSEGYDGVIFENQYIVFEPNQIKSATDNIGTFDSRTAKLKYSEDTDYDSLSAAEAGVKYGININCDSQDFVRQILDGDKTIETRPNRNLSKLIGQRVALVMTGRKAKRLYGGPAVLGYATIESVKEYTEDNFHDDDSKHLVAGGEYDIKSGGKKYGYILTDVEECEPYVAQKGTEGGRSYRNLYSEDTMDYTDLVRENRELRKKYEYWKGQTRLTKAPSFTDADAKRYAKEIIKAYDSKVDINEVLPDIKKVIEDVWLKNKSYEDAKKTAGDIARKIVMNAEALINGSEYEKYKEIKNYLKDKTFYITLADRMSIPDYEQWRKNHRYIKVVIDDAKANMDKMYQDLRSTFSTDQYTLFPDVSNGAEQLLTMAESIDSLDAVYDNPFSNELADAIEGCANEIIDLAFDRMAAGKLNEKAPTFADKAKKKEADAFLAGQMSQGADDARHYGSVIRNLEDRRQRTVERLQEVRQKRDEEIYELKMHFAEVQNRKRVRKEESEARQKLLKIVNRLSNKKMTAANRALIDSMIADIDKTAVGISEGKVKQLEDLRDWYNTLVSGGILERDERIENQINRLNLRHIKDMSIGDVRTLANVLLGIEYAINHQNKLIESQYNRDMWWYGMETAKHIRETNDSTNAVDDFFVTKTLSPVRAMKRFTGYNKDDALVGLTNELAEGQRKSFDYVRRAEALFTKYTNDKKFIDSITGKNAKLIDCVGSDDEGNHIKFQMTPAMRMSLYLHFQNADNMRHIISGGITVPNYELYKKGDMAEAYAKSAESRVFLTMRECESIIKGMTAKEKNFADAMHDYFNGMSRNEINVTSEALKGYSLADVENYFPIDTDKTTLQKDYGTVKPDGAVSGLGFTHERVKAGNAIYLYDATMVLNKSVEAHAKYVGLSIPVRNMSKLMSTGGVSEALSAKWGTKATHYIEKMMEDVQNVKAREGDPVTDLFGKLRSNYAGAVLTLNAGVAMKQAASYFTAASVLGYNPLLKAKGELIHGTVDINKVSKYTPLLWYRARGYSSTELGDLKSRDKQIPKALNWIQTMDLKTTTALWKACEYYVREQNPGKYNTSSDEFGFAVAEVYNRVIEETQPNYSAMQRPEWLRTKQSLTQALMMFKTQPFQNFNILYDSIAEYKAVSRRAITTGDYSEVAEARKAMSRAVTSQLASAITFVAIQAAWDAFRGKHYGDDDDENTVGGWLKKIGANILSAFTGMLPIVSTAFEAVEAIIDNVLKNAGLDAIFDQKYYGLSVSPVEVFNDIEGALQNISGKATKILSGNSKDTMKDLQSLFKSALKLAEAEGIPASNVINLFESITHPFGISIADLMK